MEFKHVKTADKEVIAYLDYTGELILAGYEGLTYCIDSNGLVQGGYDWKPNDDDRNVKFYKGDEVTLKF